MTSYLRALLLTSLLALVAACGGEPAAPQAPPPPEVGVLRVQPQTVTLQRDLVGRLAPFRSADVRARVAGVLLERVYQEGSDVAEGDILFRIDPAPLRATLAAAQAGLAQAQAAATNARIAAERGRELAPRDYISKSDLDNLEAAERSANAAVQSAQAAVTSARINLEYATVRAPISGRAGVQRVTEGALVGQGEATLLTTIEQLDPLYATFSMSALEMEQLRRAQAGGSVDLNETQQAQVQVVLPDGRLYGEIGQLDFSDASVDPATGAISLRAHIPNPHQQLMPGMFVTVRVDLGQRHNVVLLPHAALSRDATGGYVLVVEADGTVARRTVDVDGSRDGHWLVTGGLASGDQVIVSGLQRVQPGAPAVATPWQPEPSAAPATDGAADAADDPDADERI